MSDVNDAGGAPAPAESTPAPAQTAVPVNENPASRPEPLGSQTPVDQEKVSLRETLRQAHEKAVKDGEDREAKAKEEPKPADKPAPEKPDAKPAPKVEAKTEPEKPAQPRGDGGKFASPDPTKNQPAPTQQQPAASRAPHDDAPTRFSEPAKADWASAPESVRAEAHRAITELTAGYEKHREAAQAYEQVRPYADLAAKHNTTIQQSMDRYIAFERMIHQNPIEGLKAVAQDMGFSIRDAAAAILGESPDQVASQQDGVINQLRQQVSRLEQQLGGVAQNMHQQTVSRVEADVQAFAADKPRFEELSQDIAFFLKSDKVDQSLAPQDRLAKAYDLAERLNPAPAAAPASLTPEAPLNPAAGKSVSGAPSAGSNPVRRSGPPKSIRDELKAALNAGA